MDILDTVCEKDLSEAYSDINATLVREGARLDSDPDDNGSSIFVNYPKADWVDARIRHALLPQVVLHGNMELTLPDVAERMLADRM